MNLKKILSGAVIGAFVFGVSASNIQPVSAADKTTLDKIESAKDKFDSAKDKFKDAKNKFGKDT